MGKTRAMKLPPNTASSRRRSAALRGAADAHRYADASRPRNGAAAPPLVMLPLAPLASA